MKIIQKESGNSKFPISSLHLFSGFTAIPCIMMMLLCVVFSSALKGSVVSLLWPVREVGKEEVCSRNYSY